MFFPHVYNYKTNISVKKDIYYTTVSVNKISYTIEGKLPSRHHYFKRVREYNSLVKENKNEKEQEDQDEGEMNVWVMAILMIYIYTLHIVLLFVDTGLEKILQDKKIKRRVSVIVFNVTFNRI